VWFGFQFLMVRLKAVYLYFLRYFYHSISIPYGAIKSDKTANCGCNSKSFQFLMVRLKVIDLIRHLLNFKLFQFLMVRLKVSISTPLIAVTASFQFLMVRLKVLLIFLLTY